ASKHYCRRNANVVSFRGPMFIVRQIELDSIKIVFGKLRRIANAHLFGHLHSTTNVGLAGLRGPGALLRGRSISRRHTERKQPAHLQIAFHGRLTADPVPELKTTTSYGGDSIPAAEQPDGQIDFVPNDGTMRAVS